jgi:hypothetical protein
MVFDRFDSDHGHSFLTIDKEAEVIMNTKIMEKIKIQNRNAMIIFTIVWGTAFSVTFWLTQVISNEIKSTSSNDLPKGVESASAPISDGLKDGDATPCNALAGLEAYSYTDDHGNMIDVPSGMDLYLNLWRQDQDGTLMINIQSACTVKIQEFNDHNDHN